MVDDTRVVTEAHLRRIVTLDTQLVDMVEGAFVALAEGRVVMPPIMSVELHDRNAEIDAKTAYVSGLDSVALKVSTGFFDNPKQGLSSLGGMVTVLSALDGSVRAVLLDRGYLTDLRTAAAGAVAARHLAPESVSTAGVIGTVVALVHRRRAWWVALLTLIGVILVWVAGFLLYGVAVSG